MWTFVTGFLMLFSSIPLFFSNSCNVNLPKINKYINENKIIKMQSTPPFSTCI